LGHALENVRVLAADRRHVAIAMMWISWALTPYAWQTLRKRYWSASSTAFGVERAARVAQLCNALLFLWNGHYISLYARVWRVRMAVATRGARRNAAFGALNRELVWQGVTELLLVLAPLVDLRRVAALAKRWLGAAVPAATPTRPSKLERELWTKRALERAALDSSELQAASSSSSSEPCMYCGEMVLQRAVLHCCNDAHACYWCAASEQRLGGVCPRCSTPL
jgi:hypothetical protein